MMNNKKFFTKLRLPLALAAALFVMLSGLAFTAAPATAAPITQTTDDHPMLERPLLAEGSGWIHNLCSSTGPGWCKTTGNDISFDLPEGVEFVELEFVAHEANNEREWECVDIDSPLGHIEKLCTGSGEMKQVGLWKGPGNFSSRIGHHFVGVPGAHPGSMHFEMKIRAYGALPIDPTCVSLTRDPVSGYAPLSVRFNGQWEDPDGLIARTEIRTGDGGTINLTGENASYVYETPGEFTAVLVLVAEDGREFTSEGCRAPIEAIQLPAGQPTGDVDASCESWSALVAADINHSATYSVSVDVNGEEFYSETGLLAAGESKKLEGQLDLTVDAIVTVTYSVTSDDNVTAGDSEVFNLDCGPQPEPGTCQAATLSVTNVPDEGAMVTVSAQAVGIQAVISVNGLQVGQPVPVTDGTATFSVFVKPEDAIVVVVRGEDGVWATSPACQLTITVEPERCPSSFVTAYVYFDESGNGLWEAGNSIPTLGTLDWQSAGEAGLNGVSVVVPTNSGLFSGTTQQNGWAFTTGFYSSVLFSIPVGGYDSVGSPLPFMVNGETWSVTGVATLATDGTGIQTPVAEWPLEEGGHCGARVFLIGLVPTAQPVAEVAEAVPAFAAYGASSRISQSDFDDQGYTVNGTLKFLGREVAVQGNLGNNQTSDWDKAGHHMSPSGKPVVGLHIDDANGSYRPGADLYGLVYGSEVNLDSNGYTVIGAEKVSQGHSWETRLESVYQLVDETGASGALFTCADWDPIQGRYTTFYVVLLSPVG